MEDFLIIIFVIVLFIGIVTGIVTGTNYISQQNTVTRICIEIDWHSATCAKLKEEKLKP